MTSEGQPAAGDWVRFNCPKCLAMNQVAAVGYGGDAGAVATASVRCALCHAKYRHDPPTHFRCGGHVLIVELEAAEVIREWGPSNPGHAPVSPVELHGIREGIRRARMQVWMPTLATDTLRLCDEVTRLNRALAETEKHA